MFLNYDNNYIGVRKQYAYIKGVDSMAVAAAVTH